MVRSGGGAPLCRIHRFLERGTRVFPNDAPLASPVNILHNFLEPAAWTTVGRNSLESLRVSKAPVTVFAVVGRFYRWSLLGNVAHSVVAQDIEPHPRFDNYCAAAQQHQSCCLVSYFWISL